MKNLFTPASIGYQSLSATAPYALRLSRVWAKTTTQPLCLRDYHLSVAKGGVGMTTLAYAGICRSATLSFKTQLWLRPKL